MPSKAEVEAAAKAIADKVSDAAASDGIIGNWEFWLDEAKAALVAAERVRRGRKK